VSIARLIVAFGDAGSSFSLIENPDQSAATKRLAIQARLPISISCDEAKQFAPNSKRDGGGDERQRSKCLPNLPGA